MTEYELRQKVADIMTGWEGATRGSPKHLDILNTYNLHTPLARGYAVKTGDHWCAATVSAAWIKAGIAEYTGTECSCSKLIEMARKRGIWIENDKYVPKVGDAVLYDWNDVANYKDTDCTGAPEHIGIVIKAGKDAFIVLEGNKGADSVCGRRPMVTNGRYIRGFICPDYLAIAEILTEQEEAAKAPKETGKLLRYDRISDMPEWARPHVVELCKAGALQGSGEVFDENGYPADLDISYETLRTIIILKRYIDKN